MPNTATRLITLILLLQDRPNQKAAELARQLGVSVRSLHRYIAMLDEMGIPVYSERGPYGGFSLVRGYKMPPLVLTPAEAVAVSLGAGLVSETWGSLYREAATAALAKLDHLLPDEQRAEIAWARQALVATGIRRVTLESVGPLLESLRSAIHEKRTVEMTYRGANRAEAPQPRQVDPYALVHRWGWWYLVAYCHLRGAVRTFRVDRIEALQVTAAAFTLPAEFDVHAYLEDEMKSSAPVRLRMRFAPEGAEIALASRSTWDALETQPDGSVIVEMSLPDLTWAASSALSFGPMVTVLAPEQARQMVREWAQAILASYPDETVKNPTAERESK